MQKISRRGFFKSAGTTAAGTALAGTVLAKEALAKPVKASKIAGAKETKTICPYCAVGCGMIISTKNDKIVGIEGDPEHPINEGALCTKGASLYQVAVNDRRLDKVRYRAPGSSEWEEKSWEWAMERIAKNVKKTRDESFVKKEGKNIVNRTEGIASLGGAALDNEECYLIAKLMRGLGVTFLEHQARI